MEVYAVFPTKRFVFNEFPQSSFVQLLNVENIKICEDFNATKEKKKNFVKNENKLF